MDQVIEVVEEYDEIQFLVSLDYTDTEPTLYSCNEWANLYIELGENDNNPLILSTDPLHQIWNMFAGYTYSAYAFIDHNMVLRYTFDTPNLNDFQNIYIPNLINGMYGCTDLSACNYDVNAVYNDGSCNYEDECIYCEDAEYQLSCMDINGCLWIGNECVQSINESIYGCTYEEALNFDQFANIDDGSCEFMYGDINMDGTIDIFDIMEIINIILDYI